MASQLIIIFIVEIMSQFKLDHHGKPGSTGSLEVETWMLTVEETHNRTKRPSRVNVSRSHVHYKISPFTQISIVSTLVSHVTKSRN